MSDLRTVAQQALEALKMMRDQYEEYACPACDHADAAIYALRAALVEDAMQKFTDVNQELEAALAEPVQEPVAWMVYTEGGTSAYVTDNPNDLVGAYRALALYTAPPQRKPLTDEEIRDLWSWAMTAEAERTATTQQHAFARAIERAHGIEEDSDE